MRGSKHHETPSYLEFVEDSLILRPFGKVGGLGRVRFNIEKQERRVGLGHNHLSRAINKMYTVFKERRRWVGGDHSEKEKTE